MKPKNPILQYVRSNLQTPQDKCTLNPLQPLDNTSFHTLLIRNSLSNNIARCFSCAYWQSGQYWDASCAIKASVAVTILVHTVIEGQYYAPLLLKMVLFWLWYIRICVSLSNVYLPCGCFYSNCHAVTCAVLWDKVMDNKNLLCDMCQKQKEHTRFLSTCIYFNKLMIHFDYITLTNSHN